MNALDAYNTNRGQAYDDQQGFTDQLTRRQAGKSLAGGDYGGASSTLYGSGMLDAGAKVQQMGQNQQDRADERAGMEKKAEDDKRLHELGFLKDAASILQKVPAEQRQAAFAQHIAPALKMQGMPDEMIAQIASTDLDDQTLQAFGAEVENSLKLFNTSGGVVGVDTSDPRNPKANVLYQDPSYQEYRAAQTDATRARAESSRASAARARRPPAARGGSSPSGIPAGFVLD